MTAQAGLAALAGHAVEAREGFEGALAAWAALDLLLDRALCVVDAVTVLPASDVPAEAIDQARQRLTRLRAVPLLERLEAAISARAPQ